MSDYEILIASDVDYDQLIAEIYIRGEFAGLLSQDSGEITFEIPPAENAQGLARSVSLATFMRALQEARGKLLGPRRGFYPDSTDT